MTTASELSERQTALVCTSDCMAANGCTGYRPCVVCGEPVCKEDCTHTDDGVLCPDCSESCN